jgi:hypothetical protein
MSSRSLAAARARRAGENAPPVSGNRPGTSVNSHAAFAPQQSPNVRVAKSQQMPQKQYQKTQMQDPAQDQTKKGLPFTKLSISDAIGLITLRLGRVEQWVLDTEHENETNPQNLPENAKIIDNSVFASIMNRLETIEKTPASAATGNNADVLDQVTLLNTQIAKVIEEGNKHTLAISKQAEQLLRFERELVETKDILKTFMIKYDGFTEETNNKFSDFELAMADLEKNIQLPTNGDVADSENNMNDIDVESNDNASSIMSVDLKNIIKQEFA